MDATIWTCACQEKNDVSRWVCAKCASVRPPGAALAPAAPPAPTPDEWGAAASAPEVGSPAPPAPHSPASGAGQWETPLPGTGHPPAPPAPPSPPVPRLPRVRPSWLTPQNGLLTCLAALALIAVIATIAMTGNHKPPDPGQVTSLGPPNTDSDAQVLQGQVNELASYVEKARGLKFAHPVKAVVYSDKEFDSHLQALGGSRLDTSAAEAGRIATYQALGMIPLDYNPKTAAPANTSNILGYYDPDTRQLAVRGAFVGPFVRKTLVHELTHALQDQTFGLKKLLVTTDVDQSLAVRSLVEGDARRIENGYVSTLGPTEQDLLERDARGKGFEEFPIGFQFGFSNFPYTQGSRFTDSLIASGGQAQLDRAFAAPPRSSKQIIQPDKYLSGDNPVAVAPPPADGAVVDHGTMGEFELVYVLGQSINLRAAAGLTADWAGSSYVTWRGKSGPCTRIRLANESALGAEGMTAALEAWASLDAKRSVSGGNPLTLTACA